MVEASSFADTIRDVSGDLRSEPHSPLQLNHAAARIDHLGRRLHGLGWVRGLEIGGCLTAAVLELDLARSLPEADRAESVRTAILQLEEAVGFAYEGLHPQA